MGKRTEAPTVNAGSMADIAFLLLIFFLVTTTIETDAGLDRKLPSAILEPTITVNDRNILEVVISRNNELMVEGNPILLTDLRKVAVAFIDNGADKEGCNYCKGERDKASSENPFKAIISIKNHRETTYETYIAVQNELVAAYHVLRNREGQRRYQQDYTTMEKAYSNLETSAATKQELKLKIRQLQEMYPLHIVEPLN